MALALLASIRLGLPATNALAYYGHSKITDIHFFQNIGYRTEFNKTFTPVIYERKLALIDNIKHVSLQRPLQLF